MKDPRRFSLEDDFMNYTIDDLFYGLLRTISTTKPTADGKHEEYLLKSTYTKHKQIAQDLCGCTTRTLNNRLNKLKEKNLVKEGTITIKGKQYSCFYFPYDINGLYKIIEKEMVKYLIYTRNSSAIKIYLYLLNKSTFKDGYLFTIKEIKQGLGYSEQTTSANDMIRKVLESFRREGVIDYSNIQEIKIDPITGEEIPITYMKLNSIITQYEDLERKK